MPKSIVGIISSITKYELFDKIFTKNVFSNNIIIMTYLESDNKNDLTDFKTTNLFMKLMLYNLACGYNGICHGDLHSGNWGIRKNKIILDLALSPLRLASWL